ncbi:MAG: HAD family phosphatase [Reichenbachiella sp.]|uniref:HAD family hydrolase n=1 Tax=Reichenbachiella sp. TaxID=2184521 RepID=UPI00329A50D5
MSFPFATDFLPFKIVSKTALNLEVQCYIFAQNYTNKQVNIKTIIFDLGGVIIDLDFKRTPEAFSKLTDWKFEDIYQMYFEPGLLQDYEKGLLSDQELRKGINDLFGTQLTDAQIDKAWCAMLGSIPKARLDFMNELRKKHQVLVLSNTNAIHVEAFNQTIKQVSGEESLEAFADEVYFSHELKMRKPDEEIYQEVLKRSNNKAEDCLFLDDTQHNLDTAAQLGIHTMHITHPDEIFNLTAHV